MKRLRRMLVPLLIQAACVPSDRGFGSEDAGTFGPGGTDVSGMGTSSEGDEAEGGAVTTGGVLATTSDTGDEEDGEGGSEAGVKFDAPAGGGIGSGCEKIDFLFVIDNSGSMTTKQDRLVTSFPGFVDAIQADVQGQDHHIMVVDTDGPLQANCAERAGAGRTASGSTLLTDGMPCAMPGVERYTTDEDPALVSTFACIARVGIYGDSNERPMEGLIEALSPQLNEPGGCNAEFLRDDAVLVVTIITDTDDSPLPSPYSPNESPSPGDPASWRQALIDAKNGNEEAIVMLGIVGDNDLPNPLCSIGGGNDPSLHAEAPTRIRELIDSFGPRGLTGSACAPDYAPFFSDAIALIDATCDEFEPEG